MKLRVFISVILTVFTVSIVLAENEGKNNKIPPGYIFEDEIILPATPVKDQYRTGTCWSFSALSFLESEMLRPVSYTHLTLPTIYSV